MNDKIEEKAHELWKLEYEKRLEQDTADGLVESPKPEDRRREPRLNLKRGKNIWIKTSRHPAPVLNISKGGVAFQSDHPYFPHDRIDLTVSNTLSVKAFVLNCELVESDPIFMEYRYEVRAQFAEGENGYKIYVLARDIYLHDLEKPFTSMMVN